MKLRLFIFSIIFILASCSNEVTRSMEPKANALGKLNEIVVIADDDIWESAAGDTFKYYYQSAYPIMPQPEPMFDLRHFSTIELNEEPLRKELRTYAIIADLSDGDSPTTQMVKKDLGEEKFNAALRGEKPTSSVGKNKWANGQLLVYLFGKDKYELEKTIKNSFPSVSKRVHSHDEKQLKATVYAVEQVNLGLSKEIKERFDIEMQIPGKYTEALDVTEENFMWIRRDKKDATLSMMITKLPYYNTNQVSKEQLIELRNKLGKKYITTETEGSYMVVNDEDLPVYEYTENIDGFFTRELRGVWEMSKDFMGGAFATYAIVKDLDKEIIFVDVFVLAPGEDKRDHMQQLDYIVKSAKIRGIRDSE